MKVGIIGGGIAGLTCGYRLTKRKIKVVVYEKEPLIGGRLHYNMGAIGSEERYRSTATLVRELDLGILKVLLDPNSLATLSGDKIEGLEAFQEVLEGFSEEEKASFQELNEFVLGLSFDVRNPSPELQELRKISFAEYIKKYPEKVKRFCIDSRMNFTFETDYKKLAADFALFTLRHEMDLISGKAYVFEEGLLPLGNVLAKKIKDSGSQLLNSAEVKKVEKVGTGFKIHFIKNGREATELVDKVVFATPLPVTQELFPELDLKTDIEYKPIKCIFVEGELRHKQKLLVGLRETDKSNILGFSALFPHGHIIIPFNQDRPVDFSVLYKKHRVMMEKELKAGWPVVPPNAHVPELHTSIEGAFICGDFYFYPIIETAVTTAEMVAKMIS